LFAQFLARLNFVSCSSWWWSLGLILEVKILNKGLR
jgi:hypothetical protein